MVRSIVSLWHGAYLVEDGRVLDHRAVPADSATLAEREGARSRGELTPEERELLGLNDGRRWTTRDRRLVGGAVEFDLRAPAGVDRGVPVGPHRDAVLAAADRALLAAWDPSVHVQEAVRSLRDLDRALNLLGERLAGWASHDAPGVDPDDPTGAARSVLAATEPSRFGPSEPTLVQARRRLAELFLELRRLREEVDRAVVAAAPSRTPNLSALLGAELSSLLLAQAGGLDRLARLPASTVQVLGAEKAFFEHLRGRAPPPRHGLLFLHPSIQSATRVDRGRLARSLAAKVAIAARLDQAGRPVDPTLRASYERRREELKGRRAAPRDGRPRGRSRPPLDRAAQHG